MWSRKGVPVETVARPVPSVSSQRMVDSFVSRVTTVISCSLIRCRSFAALRTTLFAKLPGYDYGVQRAGVQRHSDHDASQAAVLERSQILHRRHTARGI